ncbi:DEAD/DEAH box helicase [Actinoplanes sp. NPDC026619]|uniref:DEAD/DEAH box helicase n=1 Tax=Actinoplanes sp. NPDC026619 TaxID=3155798 RepID=UPI003411CCEA
MFNRGIDGLLAALPEVADLDVDSIRRLLTAAWLETTTPRFGDQQSTGASVEMLRRMATALELHAILPLAADRSTVRACAFVAAEALTIAHELLPAGPSGVPEPAEAGQSWMLGSVRTFERVEAALLYLVAGYDANAALTVADLGINAFDDATEDGPVVAWAANRILALCRVSVFNDEGVPASADQAPTLHLAVRRELWRRIGLHVGGHLDWLTFGPAPDAEAGAALRALAEQLENRQNGTPRPAGHADLHHLLLLLASACDETGGRSLRGVPPPPDDPGDQFGAYQRTRATGRPLLWPAAQAYAHRALPGPTAHAVVTVPTGSGKSSVAELAISQALSRGWVLYLAPTNALVGQIRRQVADVFGRSMAREFLGGAEYTQLSGESLDDINERQVLVMTPEKCSLALRQNPEAFADLSLCIFDEAHLLGERGGRGVIAELVLAEIMHRATGARLLLMSALIANPGEIGEWLSAATGAPAAVVDAPWRPTRTLRSIAGIDRERGIEAGTAALRRLEKMGPNRKKEKFDAPVALLAGLQGAWTSSSDSDYKLVRTDIEATLAVNRDRNIVPDGYCTPTAAAIVQRLGERGDKVLAFLPRSRHDGFRAAGLTAFEPIELDSPVAALIRLADLELGVPSALRVLLQRRVAVHTSALLREEQRASEIAFDSEAAIALYATGTMAQGLNLPATAVVIGGTDIGYDENASEQQRQDKTRAQLLNAIGRAGRAHVAPRSMAVVVPNKAVYLSSAADAQRAVQRARFLRDEDASTDLQSTLDELVLDALAGGLSVDSMSSSELTAFSFLTFAADDRSEADGVVARDCPRFG